MFEARIIGQRLFNRGAAVLAVIDEEGGVVGDREDGGIMSPVISPCRLLIRYGVIASLQDCRSSVWVEPNP